MYKFLDQIFVEDGIDHYLEEQNLEYFSECYELRRQYTVNTAEGLMRLDFGVDNKCDQYLSSITIEPDPEQSFNELLEISIKTFLNRKISNLKCTSTPCWFNYFPGSTGNNFDETFPDHMNDNISQEEVTDIVSESDLDIVTYYKSLSTDKRIYHAKCGEGLDILVNDESPNVRRAVAMYGRDKDLDILVNDKSAIVRVSVAACGRDKDLDILAHDRNNRVLRAVITHGRKCDLEVILDKYTSGDIHDSAVSRYKKKYGVKI